MGDNLALQYFAWVTLPVFLVLFSAGFVHLVAPQVRVFFKKKATHTLFSQAIVVL